MFSDLNTVFMDLRLSAQVFFTAFLLCYLCYMQITVKTYGSGGFREHISVQNLMPLQT